MKTLPLMIAVALGTFTAHAQQSVDDIVAKAQADADKAVAEAEQIAGQAMAEAEQISAQIREEFNHPADQGNPPIPSIPPIIIPDLAGITPEWDAFTDKVPLSLNPGSGIRITPARCENGTLVNARGITEISDLSAVRINGEGRLSVNKDGSGEWVGPHGRLTVNKDRSGEWVGGHGRYTVRADGSGEWTGKHGRIAVDGKGAGEWSGREGRIIIRADGSGEWNGANGRIAIQADGSGEWSGPYGRITRHADGSGEWSGYHGRITVKADGSGEWSGAKGRMTVADGQWEAVGAPSVAIIRTPWPPAPKVGKLNLLEAFTMPGKVCGYLITLEDKVLFDFDKYDIRHDAAAVLDELAQALGQVSARSMEIRGHTDSKGTDEYNQTLSEKRAHAVAQALAQRGKLPSASARGYGESQPVAPNEVNGEDSPENRQLNRRVEIFVQTQ